MTSYPFFSRWPPVAILDLIRVMLDHPRSAIAGLSSVLKFGFDPIYSFGDIVIFYILYTFFIHQRTGSKVKKKRNTGNKLK